MAQIQPPLPDSLPGDAAALTMGGLVVGHHKQAADMTLVRLRASKSHPTGRSASLGDAVDGQQPAGRGPNSFMPAKPIRWHKKPKVAE